MTDRQADTEPDTGLDTVSETPQMLSWFVYVLRCADDSLYTGVTTDIDRRLREHNGETGKGARYTRPRRPVTLAYHETAPSRSDACRREAEIKQMNRAQKQQLIRPTPSSQQSTL